MKMKLLAIAFIALISLKAQSSGLQFLVESYDAVSLASGSAILAPDEGTHIDYLPAQLHLSEKKHLSASYQSWISDIDVSSVRYGSTLFSLGFAVHATFLNIANIEQRNIPSSEPINTFSNYNSKIALSFSKSIIKQLHAGITYKFIREKNAIYTAEGGAFDFNLLLKLRKLSAYASYYNLGNMQTLRDERTKLPEMIAFGVRRDFKHLTGGFEVKHLDDTSTFHSYVQHQPFSIVRVMFGYILNDDSRNWSAGFTLSPDNFHITYAYANHRYLDFYQNIQIAISF